MEEKKDHFQGKDAKRHLVELQARGVLASSEVHGAETPGSLFAAYDAAREIALFLALLLLLLPNASLSLQLALLGALVIWKAGRASFLAFYRLERLHRVVKEEQRELLENRQQEKEELKELYQAKGFDGKLLDDVVDVLMADGERALQVMLEEEMGFRLEENEHPLVQGCGAAIGALLGGAAAILGFLSCGLIGLFVTLSGVFGVTSFFAAYREKNSAISAVVWTIGLAILALATGHYLL